MRRRLCLVFTLVIILVTMAGIATGCNLCNSGDVYNNNYTVENINYAYEAATKKASLSSVLVHSSVGTGTSSGSGVIISQDGYVLTNDHVVRSANSIEVEVLQADGKIVKYSAEAIAEKPDGTKYYGMDMALIKIKTEKGKPDVFTPAEFAKAEDLVYGKSGIMIGNPKNVGFMVSKAMISNPSMEVAYPKTINKYIALDAPVNPGNSGGGFYDIQGRLLGIVTLRQYEPGDDNKDIVFGIGFAIRIDDVNGYLARYTEVVR